MVPLGLAIFCFLSMPSVNKRRVGHASYSALGIYVEDIVLGAG